MSNGHQHDPNEFYGFGGVGMGNINPLSGQMPTSPEMGTESQPGAMMPLLDNSAFSFDGLPITLDSTDDYNMAQAYQPMPNDANAQNTLIRQGGDQQAYQQGADENVPGAGPMPMTNFGSPANMQGGSTLTEFTKRRNWPAKVVEELKDLLQILDSNGRLTHVSPSIVALTGWSPEEVTGRFLREFLHIDDIGVFTSELNESIASGHTLRMFYRLRKKDGTYAIFESVGHAHIAAAKFAPNPNNQSPFCQAVFMMSRPYPTKNTSLLDSFLEHKIENERLKRRIGELKKEEADDADEARQVWQSQEGRSEITPSEGTMTLDSGNTTVYYPATDGSHLSERQTPLNIALTRENLEGIAGVRPDSITEKMARYEGATHVDTIEMLTGLRYQEGERSRGISTGNVSPKLIKGDAGIAMPADRDPRTGEKKKKMKITEEYVCTDCGTLESPEWRKGPSGPKTLCNACGLRWAKKEKKKSTTGGHGGNNYMDHVSAA